MSINWDGEGVGDIYPDLPWAQHTAENGKFLVNMRMGRSDAALEIAPETDLIIDFGGFFIGYCQYNAAGRPKYKFWLNPAHLGLPERPDVPNLRDALKCQVMIANIGPACLTLRGSFNANAMNRYIAQYRRAPQAVAGQLPTWKLKPSISIEWEEKLYSPIVLERWEPWVDRDLDVFGERYVPPPKGRGGTTVVGYTPSILLPGTPAAPVLPVAAMQTAPVAVAPVAASVPSAVPTSPIAPVEAPAVTVAAAPAVVPEAMTFDGPSPARGDPFEIFRRGNQPTPRPIPRPSEG
jgi:hypothetical protein